VAKQLLTLALLIIEQRKSVKPKIIILFACLLLLSCGTENTTNERIVSTEIFPGAVHFTQITSGVRGYVALEVYLPPGWNTEGGAQRQKVV